MEAPSSTLNRNSRPLRPKRRGLESGLMESHRTTHPYDYESRLRASRQAPPHTTTSPSCIIAVDGPKARKYRDSSDPRRHKSPALSLRPPQAASRLQRRNPPPNYPYDASPVSLWPSRDPIGELGGINLYGMAQNSLVNFFDVLGLHCRDCDKEKRLADAASDRALEEALKDIHKAKDDLILAYKATEAKAKRLCDKMPDWMGQTAKDACYSTAEGIASGGILAARGAAGLLAAGAQATYLADMAQNLASYKICQANYGEDEDGCPCPKKKK